MTLAIWFWMLMALWLFFGVWRTWPDHLGLGSHLLGFFLFVILGWQVFGSPVK